ncbi:MAG: hypothetical protein BWY17_02082 [Deltaproteobacteria bacterium ADurb.Bin207]|nr:MAG: hypothetical protein BWY17_02082 [Deltaproteobacteria bacterium ADurb.Bin207]HOR33818.1 hypothetical protein [Polyangiaceae bacterium]HPK94766.1 hypothetical protein [Polyangiaceae bacterium]HQB43426.1 hypothetical protein [Polyangiaceae bacterium]HQF23179.1 hypothetical protein [Polyangiaceae bacterium]
MRWTLWLVSSMSVVVSVACAHGEDARDFVGLGGTGHTGGASGTAGIAGEGASAGQAGGEQPGGASGEGGGPTGGSGGSTGGSGGSTGGSGGSTGGSGGSTGGSGGSTGGSGGSTGGSGGSTGGSGGTGGATCTPPVSGPCDNFPQCGCEPDEACDIKTVAGTTDCFKTKNIPVSSKCAAMGECVAGASCIFGGCKNFCEQNSDCPKQYAGCFQVTYSDAGQSKPVPHMMVCSDQCEPWNPSGTCGGGLSCEPFSDVGQKPGTSVCADTGATSNATCSQSQPFCAPGYACLSDNRCYRWCRVGKSDCPGLQTCYGLISGVQEGLYVGNTEIGVCDY